MLSVGAGLVSMSEQDDPNIISLSGQFGRKMEKSPIRPLQKVALLRVSLADEK